MELGDALFKYPSVGTIIYNRKQSPHPAKKADCYIIILQLMLAKIVCMTIEPTTKPKAMCTLGIQGHAPTYLNKNIWNYIHYT